jgi:hypothetical protein
MRIRTVIITLLMVGGSVVNTSPASAAFPEGELLACSHDPGVPLCRGAVYGIASTVEVDYDYALSNFGQLVQSVYIYVNHNYFIEFGYVQRHDSFGYSDPVWFYKGCNNGSCTQSDLNSWSGFSPIPEGNWQIAIYKRPTSPNTFRFWVKSATGTKYVAPATYTPAGFGSGLAITAQEIAVDNGYTEDEVGNRHDNIWLLNSQLDPTGWVTASGNLGMTYFNDSSDYYLQTFSAVSGHGDNIRYLPV